ncbi:MAG: transposase family protein [Myxococcota bacterium]|nr:transposase family protein [Myxococcota bacterium]
MTIRFMIDRWLSLAGLTRDRFERVMAHLPAELARGRPWSLPRPARVLLACVALRTNLTMRELAALFATSPSTAHRVVVAMTMTPRLAAGAAAVNRDRRWGVGRRRHAHSHPRSSPCREVQELPVVVQCADPGAQVRSPRDRERTNGMGP